MPGVEVKGTDQMVQQYMQEADAFAPVEEPDISDGLHGHIMSAFQEARDARETGGVNDLMMEGLRAFNGTYSSKELIDIEQSGGSAVYMNLTSTKVRVCASQIKDIELNDEVIAIQPTPLPQLPEDIVAKISEAVESEFQKSLENDEQEKAEKQQQPQGQPAGPEGSVQPQQQGSPQGQPQGAPQAPQQPQKPPQDTIRSIKEINEFKRDMTDAILEEINSEAKFAFNHIETAIRDQMLEGGWEKALSDFIDDFCIFPTAIMKGPIVSTKKKLKWENGVPVVSDEYAFINKRISPLDIYPAPEATDVNDGNFIEHLRLSRVELLSLRSLGSPYDVDKITKVLEDEDGKGVPNLDETVEQEKADEELRDNQSTSNKNVYHGLHFFGAVEVKLLKEWGLEGIDRDDEDIVEVEAILVGSQVIKVVLNKDPLGRRPYYSASYQTRPGAFWGTSLPYSMRDIQRICNATARELMNNMSLSSGPQAEVYVDRLADAGDVEEVHSRKIWQVTSDPMGAGGRAVQFFSIPSNAAELLKVYEFFEAKADDVTMIPKWAYGNEKVGGAAQTATGLSMLLETASKGIKDCIRHIDLGVIIPRVEYEFYHLMLKGDLTFTGDINVIARGSKSLTNKASEALKRQEFLRIVTMPAVLELIGKEGVANLIREMGAEMGFISNIVPSRHELKLKDKESAANAQAQQEAQAAAQVAPTKVQIEGQMAMHEQTMQLKGAELEHQVELEKAKLQIKAQGEDLRNQANINRDQTNLQKASMETEQRREEVSKNIALSIRGEGQGADRDKAN